MNFIVRIIVFFFLCRSLLLLLGVICELKSLQILGTHYYTVCYSRKFLNKIWSQKKPNQKEGHWIIHHKPFQFPYINHRCGSSFIYTVRSLFLYNYMLINDVPSAPVYHNYSFPSTYCWYGLKLKGGGFLKVSYKFISRRNTGRGDSRDQPSLGETRCYLTRLNIRMKSVRLSQRFGFDAGFSSFQVFVHGSNNR